MPDIAIAAVLADAVDNGLHGIDLIGPHHQQLLLAGNQHHIAAEGLAKGAFDQEGLCEAVEVGDLFVADVGEFIDRQKALFGIEGEVPGIVVREIEGAVAIADDEKLKKTEQGLGVAVAGIVLVVDDLLHGPARADAKGLEFDLNDRHTIDEEDNVIPVMAVVGIDAQLVDHLKGVFAPVLNVDQGVV